MDVQTNFTLWKMLLLQPGLTAHRGVLNQSQCIAPPAIMPAEYILFNTLLGQFYIMPRHSIRAVIHINFDKSPYAHTNA